MMRGGKREGAGRKPGSTMKPRTVLKQQRWTVKEWAEVLRRAEEAGSCPSDYIRGKTLKSNAEIIKELRTWIDMVNADAAHPNYTITLLLNCIEALT